jgi:hypothetical protein
MSVMKTEDRRLRIEDGGQRPHTRGALRVNGAVLVLCGRNGESFAYARLGPLWIGGG